MARSYPYDPVMNKVVATIKVGPTGNSGPNWLGSGFGSIWVSAPNVAAVVRIEPTDKVQAHQDLVEAAPRQLRVHEDRCLDRRAAAATDHGTDHLVTNVVAAVIRPAGLRPRRLDLWGGLGSASRRGPAAPGSSPGSRPNWTPSTRLSPDPTFGGGGDLIVAANRLGERRREQQRPPPATGRFHARLNEVSNGSGRGRRHEAKRLVPSPTRPPQPPCRPRYAARVTPAVDRTGGGPGGADLAPVAASYPGYYNGRIAFGVGRPTSGL